MTPALLAASTDAGDLASLLRVLAAAEADADLRRTLSIAARHAEELAARLEQITHGTEEETT